MYFKKLEIFGFKSFADKTVLNFEPGITAIVGPNGCGKSNIFDSIRWVLGEQSMKELRGSQREDVIFNGTEKKPALGFAEVNLTFSNESRMLPIDYDEVTVTRKLFRSGESEYLLNRTVVRLKDIQELMMGTGIGAEAYSLVQQGKVDLVVSSRPEDRRMILDEASGITKYKSKKKEALNKLTDTENNLLRINDIVTEVKRQIASIERQANKAKKYKIEYENLKKLEVKLAKHLIKEINQKKDQGTDDLNKSKTNQEELQKKADELAEILTNEINYLDEIEQRINDIHSQEIKIDGKIDINNKQIGFNEERIDDLIKSQKKYSEQKTQLIEKCKIQQEKISELVRNTLTIESEIEQRTSSLKEKRENLFSFEKLIRETKEKIKENEEKIVDLSSQQAKSHNELTDIMKEMQGSLARKRRLDIEKEKILAEKDQVEEKLKKVESMIIDKKEMINGLQNSRENKSRLLAELNSQFSKFEEDINEMEKRKLFLVSQKEFIEKLHTQYDDIPDPVVEGKLITQNKPQEYHTGIIGKVKEVRPIDPEHYSFLTGNLVYENAQQLYEIICETKFIELDPQQISLKIEEIAEKIRNLCIEKENLANNIQQQKGIIQEIEQEIQDKETDCSIMEAQKSDVLSEIQKLKNELDLVELEMKDVSDILMVTKKKEDSANYHLDTITQELNWVKTDIKDKQEWISNKSQEKEEILILAAQLDGEIESDKEKLKNQTQNQRIFKETLDGCLDEITKIDEEVSNQSLKKAQFESENIEFKKVLEQLNSERESLCAVLADLNFQKDDQGQKINSVRESMNSAEEEIEKIKQIIHNSQLSEQELSFNEKGIKDRLVQTYKIDIDFMYEESECPLIMEYNNNVSDPSKLIHLSQDDSINYEEIHFEIEKLRKRCESFGNVNLVAIEEYDELKSRFEFLVQQQSDLIEAKSNLLETIRKINRSTRQMFMDTFTKVSEEFRIYFRMLFGGGEAKLILLDPENVLESGIDIEARPPGKKLQNISLLSGGEKTLTAIALIFGVFKVNPSPFCVLDEIDAALDESNVGRFSYLLKDFAKIAQFIVITHNKKTMSSADVMYGITMPENGCSKIVSVKFHEGEKKKEETQEAVAV